MSGTQAATYMTPRSILIWLCVLVGLEVVLYTYSMPKCRAFKEKGGIRGDAAVPGDADGETSAGGPAPNDPEAPPASMSVAMSPTAEASATNPRSKWLKTKPSTVDDEPPLSPSKRRVSIEDMVKMV
jgi:hypothetical protein